MLDWTGSISRSLRPNHNLYNEFSEIDIDLERLETKRKSLTFSLDPVFTNIHQIFAIPQMLCFVT